MERVKVEGHSNLSKVNGAVVNTDTSAYERRLGVIKNTQRLNALSTEVDDIKKELKSLGETLSELVDALKNR